jgi:dachs protein
MNMSSATLGISKVFILDKYFTELQKFWDTEKRLQGKSAWNVHQLYIKST